MRFVVGGLFLRPHTKTPWTDHTRARLEGAVAPLPAARHRRSCPSPAPVPPLGILALLARLHPRTPRTRPRERGLAPQQRSRSCTSPTSSTAAARRKTHSPVPRRQDPCAPSHGHFLPHRAPRRSPSGTAAAASTASCAMHFTPLTQDLKRQTTPAPPALHATLPRDMHTIGTREETSVGLRCALCAGAARTHSPPAAYPATRFPTHDAHLLRCTVPAAPCLTRRRLCDADPAASGWQPSPKLVPWRPRCSATASSRWYATWGSPRWTQRRYSKSACSISLMRSDSTSQVALRLPIRCCPPAQSAHSRAIAVCRRHAAQQQPRWTRSRPRAVRF